MTIRRSHRVCSQNTHMGSVSAAVWPRLWPRALRHDTACYSGDNCIQQSESALPSARSYSALQTPELLRLSRAISTCVQASTEGQWGSTSAFICFDQH